MKRSALFALTVIGLVACQDSPSPLGPPQDPANPAGMAPLATARQGDGIPGQYIVVFKQTVSDAPGRARQLTKAHGGKLLKAYSHAIKGFAGQLSDGAVRALRASPEVAYIEQDQVMRAIAEQPSATWGIDRVDQRDLPLGTTYVYNADGTGVKVYIIDTGIRFDHVEFGGRAVTGFDAVTVGGAAADCNGHGTHVAGTVGGSTYGVAKNVALVAVRVLGCTGSGTTSGVIQGIDWVTANHVAGQPAAANMSLGGGASQALDDAVIRSINDGVTYGVAAGNSSADACASSPARAGPALTVGSTTSTDARSSFSNFGTCLDLFAPGSSITSSWYTSSTATNTISGTSMATPHVVGAAALYLQTNPGAAPALVETALESNATTNRVTDPGAGSPNLLLYTGFISAGPPPDPPTAPGSLTATPIDHQRINLAWTDATGETSYDVQRLTGDVFATIATLGADITSYSNTGLSASTSYTYQVVARNAGGSTPSNTASATTAAPPPDTPPVARYTWSCTARKGRSCSFNATSSTDDKGISSYAWVFGDGTTGSGATPSHRFGSSGVFQVRLTVTDAASQSGSRTCAVTTGTTGTCAP